MNKFISSFVDQFKPKQVLSDVGDIIFDQPFVLLTYLIFNFSVNAFPVDNTFIQNYIVSYVLYAVMVKIGKLTKTIICSLGYATYGLFKFFKNKI